MADATRLHVEVNQDGTAGVAGTGMYGTMKVMNLYRDILLSTTNQTALTIADAGNYYTTDNVEAALQQLGGDVASFDSVIGTAPNANHLGSFLGSTISNNTNIRNALQQLEVAVEAADEAARAPTTISDNTDVDTVTNPPAIGEFLAWDGTNFVPSASTDDWIKLNEIL